MKRLLKMRFVSRNAKWCRNNIVVYNNTTFDGKIIVLAETTEINLKTENVCSALALYSGV